MTERPKQAESADELGTDDSNDSEYQGGGSINDPLTRSDVEAPRVPFESGPEADG